MMQPFLQAFSWRAFSWPIATACFAGVFAAAVLDAVALVAGGAPVGQALSLSLGILGTGGLALAGVAGALLGLALAAMPPERNLRGNAPEDNALDRLVASGLLAGLAGALVLAAGAAAGNALLVGAMASRKLAVIATFGVTLALCPLAVLVTMALLRSAHALAQRLPRPTSTGTSGLLLIVLVAGGVLVGIGALSLSDWRVLDLGPLKFAALATVVGVGHSWFWYGSRKGRKLEPKLPARRWRGLLAIVPLALLVPAARLPESAAVFTAAETHGWGVRFGLKLARGFSDRDGDGFSAAFGGGDCDDQRADVFPGAQDLPGDGIDQDCEGGDARALEQEPEPANPPSPSAQAVAPAEGAFTGNILIVAVDTLRADRLGVAGYQRPPGKSLTPTMDALAKRSAYFRRVWAQAPNTPRSFPSFVTSQYPSRIAWKDRTANYSAVLPSSPTVFESLAAGGWKAIGIFSHFYFTPERGLARGFAEWSNEDARSIADSNKDVASPRVVPQVIERLRKAAEEKQRFVLWTHLFEPHSSYVTHPEFPTSLTGIEGLKEKYDYEIAFADLWLGKLFEGLAESGLADTTAVIVLADHGEAWGEHKRYFHGHDTSEEQLRVPLIISVPGFQPQTIDDNVGLIDLAPTILDLTGLPIPPSFAGRSLLPLLRGQPLTPRPVFAEVIPATAWKEHEVMMVDGNFKLTNKITARRRELHDLEKDPQQKRDLSGQPAYKDQLDKLRERLLRFEESGR